MPYLKPRAANTGFGVLCIGLAAIALALHSPGHVSTDTSIQLHEALTGRIESWAPPFMSALLYWLGLGTLGTALFVLLNAAFTYGALYLSGRHSESGEGWPLHRYAIALILVLNPVVFVYVGIVWKDVLLGSLCALGLAFSLQGADARTRRASIIFSSFALLALLPIPLVRQQGYILLPVFAIAPAWQIARHATGARPRTLAFVGVMLAVAVGFQSVSTMVSASFEKGPDGRDIAVGTRIIKNYDLAGIQYRTGAEGPLARAGAPQAALDAIQRNYGGDRVDRLGGDPALSAFLGSLSQDQADAMWMQAIREHPRAYIAHRASSFAWLMGFHEERTCLPFHVGVEGIDEFLAESGISEEMERRDQKLFDWNKSIAKSLLWKHWVYIGLLTMMLLLVWFLRKDQRMAMLPWLGGLALFAGSFVPTSIACDFRYLYAVIPCTIVLAIRLLKPHVSSEPAHA